MNKLPLLLVVFVSAAAQSAPYQSDTWAEYSAHKTAVIGEDSRQDPNAFPSSNDSQKYRAVGVLICRNPNLPPGKQFLSAGTATLVENSQTIMTVAHNLVDKSGTLLTKIENCSFNIVSDGGEILQSVNLARAKGVQNPSSENIDGAATAQNDWAVARLATPITGVVPFRVASPGEQLSVNAKIKICSFSHDVANPRIKRCLSGTYKNSGMDNVFFKNPNVLLHDIDTNGNSSGAPIFIEVNGTPIIYATHKGGVCQPGHKEYNVNYCYNLGIFPELEFYKHLDTIVEETGGSIYGPAKVQKTKFITPVPANPNREVST